MTDGWRTHVLDGELLASMFGESAPAADLFRHFGLTVDSVVRAVKALFDKRPRHRRCALPAAED